MTVITLPHNFTPRIYQEDFFSFMNRGGKRAVLVWNRRAGKDVCAFNFLIYTAMETKGIYYYVFPTFAQGRKAVWDSMTIDGIKFLDFIPKQLIKATNNQEMKILLTNGSLIQVIGSDNYDAIRGTNPRGCIFSEYSWHNPQAWQTISPSLESNDGWAIFVFTPQGHNHAKEMYDMAQKPQNRDSWFCQLLTIEDTHTITEEQLDKIKREELMSPDMIEQEYFCSFTKGVDGNYYAKYMQAAIDQKRIGPIPYQPSSRVCTAWDIGIGDSCAITFFQVVGNSIHVIDYYENQGEGLSHYIKLLHDKPYVYDRHFAPHDIDSRDFGSGLSPKAIARTLGVIFTVLPTLKVSIENGIEASRSIFPRCYFDNIKCSKLIRCLENYRKEFDERLQIYKSRPLHDKFSHGADSFRYMSISVKLFVDTHSLEVDDNISERLLDIYQPRFDK